LIGLIYKKIILIYTNTDLLISLIKILRIHLLIIWLILMLFI